MLISDDALLAEPGYAALQRLADEARGLDVSSLPDPLIRTLMTFAVRAYAARVERTGTEFPPTTDEISTTEAVVTACALLRSQNLNAFDTALWFSRTNPV